MNLFQKRMRHALAVAALLTPMFSNAANVTIEVLKSDGTPYAGVQHVRYATYGYNMGNTNASGKITYTVADGTYEFRVTALGTSKSVVAAVTGDQTITFYTSALNATVQSCSGTPLSGVGMKHAAGLYAYHFPAGTNAAGQTAQEVFPGNCDVTATLNGTSETKTVTVPGNGFTPGSSTSVTFNPTTVTLGNAGAKTYKAGSYSYHANGTIYMFPGTYEFTFAGGYKANLAIAGCAKDLTVNILVLKDHNGNPLSGGTARGGSGTNFSTFHVSGNTNTDGVLYDIRDNNSNTQMSYEMRYNATTATLTRTLSSSNVFSFQTNEVKLKLETCTGTPVTGGGARYGMGSTATSYYFPGANSTDANGVIAGEFFPGTYSFEMGINASTEVKSEVVIPNANTTLTWKTTNVKINWPYDVAYGGAGDNGYFNKPGTEMLPGTVNFNFRAPGSNNYAAIAVTGCSMVLTPGIVRLISSTNAPISGASVDGYQNVTWSAYSGTTNAYGNLLVIGKNPSSLKMILDGASQQVNGVNFAVNPIVTFQTKLVTMELKDASGAPLESNSLSYYAGGWKPFGAGATTGGSATLEMLPGSYSFQLVYKGGVQQISAQNIVTNPTVSYQTKLATVHLQDMSGNPIQGGTASFFAGAWQNIGTTDVNGDASIELLPVSYSFRMAHATKSLQKNGIAVPNTITFIYTGSALSKTVQNGEEATEEQTIAEEIAIQNIELYPNPASSDLNVRFYSVSEKVVTVQLLDITGKVVAQNNINAQQGNNMHSINVSDLSAGNYMLKFQGVNVGAQKVVIQH